MYRRYCVPPVIKKSKRVITVSNYERHRINKYFGFKDNRLTAIYNGVGEHFKKVTNTKTLQHIKDEFSLPENFFFFLGNTDPKKNTKGTLKAFSDFLKQTQLSTAAFLSYLKMLKYPESFLTLNLTY